MFSFWSLLGTSAVQAQETFSWSDLRAFGETHVCNPEHRIVNNREYLAWMDFTQQVVQGLDAEDVFASCPGSRWSFLPGSLAGGLGPDAETRAALLARAAVEPDVADMEERRVRQGYAATEYLTAAYLACPDQTCFDDLLRDDGYFGVICPDAIPDGADVTSPDGFELNLSTHDGDMRQFLPYLATNCRLLARSQARDGTTPLFVVIGQIVNPE
ncbi:hypothetical protein [Rhodovulum sp. MB263]|uniref:hypothetical protein n=1 Tax=Rhodovulum sp. (strain MB263) TaxID=308754 RepID=UPI0018C88C8C|nr:hypothetical protein [Rhodovulum sp. MB263]